MRHALIPLIVAFILFSWTDARAQVVINEIGYDVLFNGETKWVELLNNGSEAVDVSTYVFCNFPNYSVVGTLGVLAGSTTIQPGAILVVKWAGLSVGNGEVGLYKDTSYSSPASILDYVEYGSPGHPRSSVATAAGIWAANESVAAAAAGESLALVNGSAAFAAKWTSASPTPGASNGGSTAAEGVRLAEAFAVGSPYPNPAGQSFELPVTLGAPAAVGIETFDLLGRKVASRDTGDLPAGEHTFAVNTAGLPPGLYLCRVAIFPSGSSGASNASANAIRSAMVTVNN